MTTDNRTNEPTAEQIVRGVRKLLNRYSLRGDVPCDEIGKLIDDSDAGLLSEVALSEGQVERAQVAFKAHTPSRSGIDAYWCLTCKIGMGEFDSAQKHALKAALTAAGVAPQEPEPGGRLDPEFRAELVEFAQVSIQAVWDDVPGGVDAATLAQNVVGAQEFAWISRGYPIAPQEPSECSNPQCPLQRAHSGPCAPEGWSPDREKLIAEAREEFLPHSDNVWACDLVSRLADALAAPVAVDEAKLAEVIAKSRGFGIGWEQIPPPTRAAYREVARDVAEWLHSNPEKSA